MPEQSAQRGARFAFVPAIIAAILLACSPVLQTTDWSSLVLYGASIFALMVAWYAVLAKQWVFVGLMLVIAVVWNPIVPFGFDGTVWWFAQWAAAIVFLVAGFLIRVPQPESR